MIPRIVCGIRGTSQGEARQIFAELQEQHQVDVALAEGLTSTDVMWMGPALWSVGLPDFIPPEEANVFTVNPLPYKDLILAPEDGDETWPDEEHPRHEDPQECMGFVLLFALCRDLRCQWWHQWEMMPDNEESRNHLRELHHKDSPYCLSEVEIEEQRIL